MGKSRGKATEVVDGHPIPTSPSHPVRAPSPRSKAPNAPDTQHRTPQSVVGTRSPMSGPYPGTRMAAPGVLALQRLAGNRFVCDVVSSLGRSGTPPAPGPAAAGPATTRRPIVQRQIENATFNTNDEEKISAAKAFFALVDQATQAAYQYVVNVPSLGVLAELDGRTSLWHRLWTEFVQGGKPKMMAAAFGYAVESLVSNPTSPYAAKIPVGFSVTCQYTSGGTRPDLVLRVQKGTTEVAWIDLTASNSANHIFSKDSWDNKVAIYAEVTYPSLDPATLALMVQNKDSTGPVSTEEFEKRQKIAQAVYEQRKQHWLEMGKKLQYSKLASSIGRSREEQRINPSIRQTFIAHKLQQTFGSAEIPDEKMVPSILAALGLLASSWGYTTGTSQSEKAGEAWLVDNDPSLPGVTSGATPIAADGNGGSSTSRQSSVMEVT